MSLARENFLEDLNGLMSAVDMEALTSAATAGGPPQGVGVLRRGMMVASLVTLEAFVRKRTEELLVRLGDWPAQYEDLPTKFRDAAILNALPALNRYALILRRQQGDYEAELISEIDKMSKNRGPAFAFSKYIAGDFTGNISDVSLKDVLSIFQVKDCWEKFRLLSSMVGFGVPSVHEIVKEIVSRRHRSAHVHGYIPASSDIIKLPADLLCVGLCFDASMTVSVEQAIASWETWSSGDEDWSSGIIIYLIQPKGNKYRLIKFGASRAMKIVNSENEGVAAIPQGSNGKVALVVIQDQTLRPKRWQIK